MQKVMVVGASGMLGELICFELLKKNKNNISLFITDYKSERGRDFAQSLGEEVHFRYLDLNEIANVERQLIDMNTVIVAVQQRTPVIQDICIDHHILCVDVSPFYNFAKKVTELNQKAKENGSGSVIMSGFFPGLSGLMVENVISTFDEVTSVNVGLLQNTNAKVGISGVLDMLQIIGQKVFYENKVIQGFKKKRKMTFSNDSKFKEVRLIDHSEKSVLKNKLQIEYINYWTAWNKGYFNKMIGLIRQIGILTLIHKINKNTLSKFVNHNPEKDENAYLTVEAEGIIGNEKLMKTICVSTPSDYKTTAMVTVALAKIAHQKNSKGVLYPFDITNLDELLLEINSSDIFIQTTEKSD